MGSTVTIKKQRFARALSAMLIAAADDPERPHLSQIQVWQSGDKFNLSASDGHWAALWTDVVSCDADTDRIGISVRDAKFLAGVLALDKPADPDDAESEEIDLDLANGIAIECDKWTVRLADTGLCCNAPDLAALVTGTERGKVGSISLNPDIEKRIHRAFKKCAEGGEFGQVEYGFGPSEFSAVLVTAPSCVELACIVMPMRPVDVDTVDTPDGMRRFIRRGTGECIHEEPAPTQQIIPGVESNPVAESGEALQRAVDAADVTVNVYAAGEKVAELKPRKRNKKAAATEVVES